MHLETDISLKYNNYFWNLFQASSKRNEAMGIATSKFKAAINAKNSSHRANYVRSLTHSTLSAGNAPGGFIGSIINELKSHTHSLSVCYTGFEVQVEKLYASKLGS
jgi:hypothetical protein